MNMQDWTQRLGYVVPSWNTVIEYETMRMAPPGVSVHFSRIAHTSDSREALAYMSEEFPNQLELLMHAKLDAVCYGCTGASFLSGREADIQLTRTCQESVGRPVVSMAGALAQAAQHLGLSRVAVAAPYEAWLLDRLVSYLEEAGLSVTNAVGLGQQANVLHTPAMAIDLARRTWTAPADGLILSCGNFRTLEVLPDIEAELGRPVLTSNQAALWNMLTATGWTGSIAGAGRLLAQ